jgi:hypothetical protein
MAVRICPELVAALSVVEDLDGTVETLGAKDVIDQENGEPHIVKRVDRPRIEALPEPIGAGVLPRGELDAQFGALFHTEDFLEGRAAAPEGRKTPSTRKNGVARNERQIRSTSVAAQRPAIVTRSSVAALISDDGRHAGHVDVGDLDRASTVR